MSQRNGFFAHVFIILLLLYQQCAANKTIKKDLWAHWEAHNPHSTRTINHTQWQQFLKKHVNTNKKGLNLIDYAHIKRADRHRLNGYIWSLSQVAITEHNRQEQLAYWINLYNALSIKLVLDHYPIDSIRNVNMSPHLFASGPWDANIIRVNGVNISLNDIEHRIVRPIWNDPRIHYAINYAAIGSPNLQRTAYTGEKIGSQLNQAAKTFVNSLRGIQVVTNNKLITSKIFTWYREDFGYSDQHIIDHVKKFAEPKLRTQLDKVDTISQSVFNWHLNQVVSVKELDA